MRRGIQKRILSVLMAAALVLTSVDVTAFATEISTAEVVETEEMSEKAEVSEETQTAETSASAVARL